VRPTSVRWLALAALAGLAGLAWWEPLAVLFAAPWLVGIAWNRRYVVPSSDAEALPSSAELAKRRLTVL
jgi:hypothetical protein